MKDYVGYYEHHACTICVFMVLLKLNLDDSLSSIVIKVGNFASSRHEVSTVSQLWWLVA